MLKELDAVCVEGGTEAAVPDVFGNGRAYLDLQLFAVNYREYTDKALQKCRSKTIKQIEAHCDKVDNPLKYIGDGNPQRFNPKYIDGLKEHWSKEIKNFINQLLYIDAEIERRNRCDETVQ